MAGFPNLKAVVDAEMGGAYRKTTWRKTPSVVTAAGFWFDLSMSPGNPSPQYYASSPLTAARLSLSGEGGIYHGGAVSPSQKFLRRLMALTVTAGAVPLSMILCDYLLYYPFVDESEAAEQTMTNSVGLSRYTDGEGVRIMAVVVAAQTGGATFTVNYTNQDGVAGRTTTSVVQGTQSVNGTIVSTAVATNNAVGPFLPLQTGDTGVRSIEGVTTSGTDTGLFTLVLVKPVATFSIRGIDAPNEVDYLRDMAALPAIADDAYLNFICLPAGSLSAAPIHGTAAFSWG